MLIDPAIRNPLAVSLGAIAGALSRYYLGLWFIQWLGNEFPYGTLVINLTGCFLMGWFTTVVSEHVIPIPPEVRLLVAVGFLGSYTTFSTYGLDVVVLSQRAGAEGWRWMALVKLGFYGIGSAVLGVLSVQLGIYLGHLGKL